MSENVELLEAISADDRSELLGLYSESSFGSLCQNLETLLEEHPNDPVIRLLWCDAQAKNNNLPLPFVASSLLDLFEDGAAQNIHPRLSFLVTKSITQLLVEAGEFRNAIFLATDFITNSNANYFNHKSEFSDLKASLLTILDEEISLAVKKRESSTYRASLEDNKVKISQAKPPAKISKQNISKKPELGKKIEAENSSMHDDNSFVLGDTESNETHRSNSATPENQKSEFLDSKDSPEAPKKRSLIAPLLFLFAILGLVVFMKGDSLKQYIPYSFGDSHNDLNNQLIFETRIDNIFRSRAPAIKPFSLDNFRTSLDDINLRLSKLTKREQVVLPDTNSSDAHNDDSQQVKKDLTEIVSLNTIPDLAPSPSPTTPVPKLPNIPDNIGQSVNLNAGTIPTRSNPTGISNSRSTANSLKTNPDGRVFGPPAISDPTKGSSNQRALDGSALQSYEVERYDQPQIYETITATNVLAAPSLLSQSITRLKSETPIHVTARMGLWLELISNEGKIGYIFAQDAEKK